MPAPQRSVITASSGMAALEHENHRRAGEGACGERLFVMCQERLQATYNRLI